MQKQKNGKTSRTIILIVFLFTMCSAIYLIEYELVNIKHELRQEFVKSQSNLFKIRSQVENFKYKKKSLEEQFLKQNNLKKDNRFYLHKNSDSQHKSTICCLKKLGTSESNVEDKNMKDKLKSSTRELPKVILKDINMLIKDPSKNYEDFQTNDLSNKNQYKNTTEQGDNLNSQTFNQSSEEDDSWMKVKVELNSFLKKKRHLTKTLFFTTKCRNVEAQP